LIITGKRNQIPRTRNAAAETRATKPPALQVDATLFSSLSPPKIDRHCSSRSKALCRLKALDDGTHGWLLRSRVAPEGAECLDGARPEDVLVVERRDGSAHEWAHPEDPLQKKKG